jgi:hypothetical protein
MCAGNREEFMEIVQDFLISSGRLNPGERRLFVEGLEISSLSQSFLHADLEYAGALANEDEFVARFV